MPEGTGPIMQEQARILVVDDSSVIRQAIRKMLKTDFDVVIAEDGEAGWAQLQTDDQIKVLITDIEMPRLDGYGFICRARAADDVRIRDLPIIAITGAEDEETKARAYACGATDFITKPLERLQLQARVQAYIQFDRGARALIDKTNALQDESVDDPLTGLRSRRYFLQQGEQGFAFAQRHQQPLSLLRLDIDHFKNLYKQYGDDAVDRMLATLAKILSNTARTEDTVARVGGAEFAVLAPNTDRQSALALAERLRAQVAGSGFQYENAAIPISISLGLVTLGVDHRNSIEDLLKLAEQRLNHAKSDGGDRVSITVFGEAIPEPEVVTLTAAREPEVSPEVVAAAAQYRASMGAGTAPLLYDLIGVDRALQVIARGDGQALEPYLASLVAQILPLLELYLRNASPQERRCVEQLRARLAPR